MVSALDERLADYLRLRRGLGSRMDQQELYLSGFLDYLGARGATMVTTELALGWARSPEGIKSITVGFRLSAVRGFARYLHAIDSAHEVPPTGLTSVGRPRPAPHIYTADQIAALVEMAGRLRPPLRALTLRTLLGMLAATGMRLGEATQLSDADVDLMGGVITVRRAKFDRVRLVPLHPTVTDALRAYVADRDRLRPDASCDRFLLSATGRPLTGGDVDVAVAGITTKIGLRTATCRPRVHDLRHTFAVSTLIDAHRRDADIQALLPVLSTYLGHVKPANTYWYLEAVPELMQLAAERLDTYEAGRR